MIHIAELVGVVEVREVALGQAGVGLDERLDDVLVDPVADVALVLEGDPTQWLFQEPPAEAPLIPRKNA